MAYELLNRFYTVDTKLMSRINLKLKRKRSHLRMVLMLILRKFLEEINN